MINITFKNSLNDGLKKYFNQVGIEKNGSKNADLLAKKKIALQLLDYIISGSSRESITPPLKFGILRGSSSVFVGSELVKANGAEANRNHSADWNTITIGFDAKYAARMHEHMIPASQPDPKIGKLFQPSERSRAAQGGGKFIERHLIADGKTLIKLYADFLKKESEG